MIDLKSAKQAKQLVDGAQRIVIVQADNPDADSLGSALAMEQILTELGKEALLYCAVDMPSYLRYMTGWSRVVGTLPSNFDLVVAVDVSTDTLLEKIVQDANYSKYQSADKLILDHHKQVQNTIDAKVVINDFSMSSTGELIFNLCKANEWPISVESGESILSSILGDTQGLSNQNTSPDTYRVVADLVELGVDRMLLEENRRKFNRMAESIFRYKGQLIAKTQLFYDDQIAIVTIPQNEINEYSPLYNPAALIQPDTLQVENVLISIVLKSYSDGKITGAIRSNYKAPIASKLAEHFGGGGHDNASGFKIVKDAKVNETLKQVVTEATRLLKELG